MNEVISSSALVLVDRLDGIERDTEVIFLELGQIFPAIKAAIDESARAAEATINEILISQRHGANAEQSRRHMQDFIEDSSRFFSQAAEQEESFSHIVEEGISGLSKLDEIIARIRVDSEEMELVSLNAMTVALKSGSAGRAFSVITDELKRLSARTILHANELSMVGGDLLGELGQLQSSLATLAKQRKIFFEAVQEALTQGFRLLDEQVEIVATNFRGLAQTAEKVRGPVSEIMQGVQVHDIIRQSLDHVRLSLKAVQINQSVEVTDKNEEQTFLAEITRLSSTLLDDVYNQVITSLTRFRTDMENIGAVVDEVHAEKSSWLEKLAKFSVSAEFDVLASDYIREKNRVAINARHVAEGVKRMDERFRTVNTILSRFKNIVIASRIEIARNNALAIVSNTVAGMMDLTERLEEDIAAAGIVTRSFSKTLGSQLNSYIDSGEETSTDFNDALKKLHAEFASLKDSRTKLCRAAESFQPFSSNFEAAIARAAHKTDGIQEVADELAAMRDNLAAYATEAEAALGVSAEQTSSGGLLIRNERLREIVERFTIFTHRQAAARIAHLDGTDTTETGASSGDVTLF